MKDKGKIIFAIEQKGGLDTFLPVIKKLQAQKYSVTVIFSNKILKNFLKNRSVKIVFIPDISIIKIKQIVKKQKPDFIFTDTNDTDFNHSLTKKITMVAKENNIPVFSFIDYWSNYKKRLNKNKAFLPDHVLVVDKKMKEDLIYETGIQQDRIFVCGNPRFDNLPKSGKEDKTLAVFFSQPFSGDHKEGVEEVKVFSDIVEAMEKIGYIKKIIIKFHPTREKNRKKYDKIIKKSSLKFYKNTLSDPISLAQKPGLIIGMDSTMLFESSLMGKKVLSYQPKKSRKNDSLISNFMGLSEAVYNKDGLSNAIKKLYVVSKKNFIKDIAKEYVNINSADKIISFMEKNMQSKEIICVVQARTGSSRLPKKVLFDLEGKPVLLRVVDRLLEAKRIDHIIVATTTKRRDNAIVKVIEGYHPRVSIFRGSEDDVLDRFYNAVKEHNPKGILRITADCPIIDPEIVDIVINDFLKFEVDYVSNTLGKRTYPRGLDVEIFSFDLLKELWEETLWETDREHVTLFARRSPTLFDCMSVLNDKDYSMYRWTLDEASDYKLIKIIYKNLFHQNKNFRMNDVIDLFKKNPSLVKINKNVEQKDPHF